jgi:soluble lytic murein transglycosylase
VKRTPQGLRRKGRGGQYVGADPGGNNESVRGESRLHRLILRTLVAAATVVALNGSAGAQNAAPSAVPSPAFTAPAVGARQPLGDQDLMLLRSGLSSARRGDVAGALSARAGITHPIARKLVLWALIDSAPDRLSFFELDQARRDLWGWARPNGRQAAAEKLVETSGMSPQRTIEWFDGAPPQTAQGAMALASALVSVGKDGEAKSLIRKTWRDSLFEADVQRAMLARFGRYLSMEDHVRRLDTLLYGPPGPAVRDMLVLVPADQAAAAQTRMAFRAKAANANSLLAALPPELQQDPGVAFERARYLRASGLDTIAMGLLPYFPSAPPHSEGSKLVWQERWALFNAAMRTQNFRAAYHALNNHGLAPGGDLADAEFFAGWIALTKMRDPALADRHFERLQKAGSSPITLGRAYYWRGRAHEARGDKDGARRLYEEGGRYNTSFYGQLAAQKAGVTEIVLQKDPAPSPADRARFEGREPLQAARMLAEIGERDLFRVFVLAIDDTLPNAEENALLVDLARGYGDQDLAMRVVRAAAQRGYVLPERGYPLRVPPQGGTAEPALILGITRQESGFDPRVRSGAGARGMMQLMPATARIVAGQMGMGYSADMLDDPDYNMRLGTFYIGQLVDQFSGSYLLAAAGYNAGPGRPRQWVTTCGDPRTSTTEPVDFIECIPFSETRNYVMRVLEGMQVYRARLNGGRAPLTLATDLKRGAYGYAGGYQVQAAN